MRGSGWSVDGGRGEKIEDQGGLTEKGKIRGNFKDSVGEERESSANHGRQV